MGKARHGRSMLILCLSPSLNVFFFYSKIIVGEMIPTRQSVGTVARWCRCFTTTEPVLRGGCFFPGRSRYRCRLANRVSSTSASDSLLRRRYRHLTAYRPVGSPKVNLVSAAGLRPSSSPYHSVVCPGSRLDMPDKKQFERLPKTVTPVHYDLFLKPDLKNFVFNGTVSIQIDVSFLFDFNKTLRYANTRNVSSHTFTRLLISDYGIYLISRSIGISNDVLQLATGLLNIVSYYFINCFPTVTIGHLPHSHLL